MPMKRIKKQHNANKIKVNERGGPPRTGISDVGVENEDVGMGPGVD